MSGDLTNQCPELLLSVDQRYRDVSIGVRLRMVRISSDFHNESSPQYRRTNFTLPVERQNNRGAPEQCAPIPIPNNLSGQSMSCRMIYSPMARNTTPQITAKMPNTIAPASVLAGMIDVRIIAASPKGDDPAELSPDDPGDSNPTTDRYQRYECDVDRYLGHAEESRMDGRRDYDEMMVR